MLLKLRKQRTKIEEQNYKQSLILEELIFSFLSLYNQLQLHFLHHKKNKQKHLQSYSGH